MATDITIFVPGSPAPQGSKKHVGRGIMIESSKYVATWRTDVKATVYQVLSEWKIPPLAGSVHVVLSFVMPRPKSAPKRTTPAAIKRPDLDKLTRAVFDALTDVAWLDDSQVVEAHIFKRIAEIDETPGVYIRLRDRPLTSLSKNDFQDLDGRHTTYDQRTNLAVRTY